MYLGKKKFRWWQKLFNFCLFNPSVFFLLFVFSLLLELYLTQGHLYLGLYSIFIYPLFFGIFKLFSMFGWSSWVLDFCFSDYLFFNLKAPKYPMQFWDYFEEPLYWYKFSWPFNEKQLNAFEAYKTAKTEWRLRPKTLRSIHNSQLTLRVQHRRWDMKLASCFRESYGIRFMHTIKTNGVLHRATGFFTKNIWDQLYLINNSYTHLHPLQKAIKHQGTLELPKDIYLFSKESTLENKNFTKFLEEDTAYHFIPLMKKNVQINTYSKNIILEYKTQSEPDLIFDFSHQKFFKDHRLHAMHGPKNKQPWFRQIKTFTKYKSKGL